MSSGKCKLKQQQDTTIHLLKYPKSKALTTPNAGKDVEHQELSFIVGGNENGIATLEKSLAIFVLWGFFPYKTKHTLTI